MGRSATFWTSNRPATDERENHLEYGTDTHGRVDQDRVYRRATVTESIVDQVWYISTNNSYETFRTGDYVDTSDQPRSVAVN